MKQVDLDYCHWMSQLPTIRQTGPISGLSIPGSHDSFTYSLVPGCIPGPDQPRFIQLLAAAFPKLSEYLLIRWSKTQKLDVIEQLQHGIRYFDIRLMAKGEKLLVLHCLVGSPIEDILSQIQSFLADHRKEVVILDFQHLYNFTDRHYAQLFKLVHFILGPTLCPRPQPWEDVVSLEKIWDHGYQVILIFSTRYLSVNRYCWPRSLCPTPWPNTTSASYLDEFLERGLATRHLHPRRLFVSQGVFTPNLATVLLHCRSSLRKTCALKCNQTVLTWLHTTNQHPNILITDFVSNSKHSTNIIRHLIKMNFV